MLIKLCTKKKKEEAQKNSTPQPLIDFYCNIEEEEENFNFSFSFSQLVLDLFLKFSLFCAKPTTNERIFIF